MSFTLAHSTTRMSRFLSKNKAERPSSRDRQTRPHTRNSLGSNSQIKKLNPKSYKLIPIRAQQKNRLVRTRNLTEISSKHDSSPIPTVYTFKSPDSPRSNIIKTIKVSMSIDRPLPATDTNYYTMQKRIGKGAFGVVYLATHTLSGLEVAIKTINKVYLEEPKTRQKIYQEIEIMPKIRHVNVIRFIEVFDSGRYLNIVLEYVDRGDLLHYIKQNGPVNETSAKRMFRQIVCAVQACHDIGIVHRDIKPDNVLLNSSGDLKLCDFGVSSYAKDILIKDQCGTPAYHSPEIILNQGYNAFCADVWSLGVVVYVILCGTLPFKANCMKDLHKLILRGRYSVPQHLTEDAVDLIDSMLRAVPFQRISLSEVLSHPWFDGAVKRQIQCSSEKDQVILKKMSEIGYTEDMVLKNLEGNEINHLTATYRIFELYS